WSSDVCSSDLSPAHAIPSIGQPFRTAPCLATQRAGRSPKVAAAMAQLDVSDALRGARILFTGATGFLGKVTLSQLLHHYGDVVDRVFVLVRKGSSKSSEQRFHDKVAQAEPFRPLLEARGEEGLAALIAEKVRVIDGDISHRWLGLEEEAVKALTGGVDVVVNCAGL